MQKLLLVLLGAGVVACLVFYLRCRVQAKHCVANLDAVAKALDNFFLIRNDLVYEGRSSQEVMRGKFTWSRWQDYGSVTVLYKTVNNHWFTLALTFEDGVLTGREFAAADDRFARDWLALDPAIYKEHFGRPATA
jgi:hypothetical protein